MNQEKLFDYLDYFKNSHNNNEANIGTIITEPSNFPELLDQLKNDYILIELNNSDYRKQLENFLRMRDDYKNFVLFIAEDIVDGNINAIAKTIQNQKTFANIKTLILSNANNFDNLNLFNLTHSTCRI